MAGSPSRGTRPAPDQNPGHKNQRQSPSQRQSPKQGQSPKQRKQSRGGPGRQRNAGRRGARPDPVRRVAYDVLWAVDQRDAYANLLLPALLRERAIDGRDAALATELTYGTLRGLQTYDAILDRCSDRSPRDIDLPVREVLRLGTHQLLATRVASHAAVATSVDLAKDVVGMRPAGFVNAVLRRVGTRTHAEWLEIIAPDRAADPVGYLAATCGYPRWIVEAFRAALGENPAGGLPETEQALAAGNTRPKITLAALPTLTGREELLGQARAPGAQGGGGPAGDQGEGPREGPGIPAAEPARWSPFGAVLPGGDPAAIPAVAEGRAFVQDEASQLVSLAAARAPLAPPEAAGSAEAAIAPWLDLCAGPGGKSAVLAALAAPAGTHLLASDVRPHRAELTRAHLRHLPNAAVIAADGRAGAWRPGSFDRVLADVPCSGLGALRRRPEARWRKSPEDVENLGGLQRDLLNAAIDAARPGGVVAYVTCSPHRAETHDVVRDVLHGRADVTVLDAPAILADAVRPAGPDQGREDGKDGKDQGREDGKDQGREDGKDEDREDGKDQEIPCLRSPGPDGRYAQFWPHRHGTDAIFLALLRRGPAAQDGEVHEPGVSG